MEQGLCNGLSVPSTDSSSDMWVDCCAAYWLLSIDHHLPDIFHVL